MIHFVFSELKNKYIFLKFDTPEDELWLKTFRDSREKNKKFHVNLSDHLNVIDPISYLPTWNLPPLINHFLFNYTKKNGERIYYASIGLWQIIYKFFKDNNVPFDGLDSKWFKLPLQHSFEGFKEIVNSWGLSKNPRDYQYEAAYKILQWKRSVSLLATRAGKTLISYIVFRYAMEYLGAKKILMIVPSIDLVKQGFNDFSEYGDFFKTECIWGGGKEVVSSNFTIGTFQSLIKYLDKKSKKYNPDFFNGYDIVFVDETHRATAKDTATIISQPFMDNLKIAFGMTGTLPQEKTTEYYCLFSLLGAKIQSITPKELMDAGYISKIHINQCRLHYNDQYYQKDIYIKCAEYALSVFDTIIDDKGKERKIPLTNPEFLIRESKTLPLGIQEAKAAIYSNPQYQTQEEKDIKYIDFLKDTVKLSTKTNALHIEQMMVHFMKERLLFIENYILPNCKYNTLILVQHVDYAEYIYEDIKKKFPHKQVNLIIGKVKKRDNIKDLLNNYNNCILIANYSILSTGITLGNLCYGILAESYKSEVLNIQSLGRGLGLSELKSKYIVYDLIDVFENEISGKNIYKQGLAKIRLYNKELYQYPYSIEDHNLGEIKKLPFPKEKKTKENKNNKIIEEPTLWS